MPNNKRKKITFRVNRDVKNRLDGKNVNTSAVLRDMVDHYTRTGDSVEAALRVELEEKEQRLREKRRDLGDIESDIDRLKREISRIETKIEQRRERIPQEAAEFAEQIDAGNFPIDNLHADNMAVQNKAAKAGKEPEAFVFDVETELEK